MSDFKKSRRKFIKNTAVVGTGIAVTSCTSKPFKVDRAPSSLPIRSVASSTEEYDFIVVGAGAGGAVVAGRLAQAGAKVLVIEAGEDYKKNLKAEMIPISSVAAEDPRTSWGFYVEHFEKGNLPSVKDSKYEDDKGGVFYPRAATIGGCTAHNAMITMYPDHIDWQSIQNISKDNSWAPSEMREYFIRLEDNKHLSGWDVNNLAREGFGRAPDSTKERNWLSTDQYPHQYGALNGPVNPREDEKPEGAPNFNGLILAELSLHDSEIESEVQAILSDKKKDIDQKVKDIILLQVERQKKGQLEANGRKYAELKAEGGRNYNKIDEKTKIAIKDKVVAVTQAAEFGRRSGPRDFLYAVKDSGGKITIKENALVTRVIFNEANVAVGVEYIANAKGLYEADPRKPDLDRDKIWKELKESGKASSYEIDGKTYQPEMETADLAKNKSGQVAGEVVLCGGAFNTPQVLTLSGVGRGETLKKFEIKPVVSSEWVGRNLQDRYEVSIVTEVKYKNSFIEKQQPLGKCTFGGLFTGKYADLQSSNSKHTEVDECWPANIKDLRHSRRYGSNGIIGGLVKQTSVAKAENGAPDLFIFPVGARFKGYETKFSTKLKEKGKNFVSWLILKGHTKNMGEGAGTVEIKSSNPLVRPAINFNYFSKKVGSEASNKDLQALTEGVEITREMIQNLRERHSEDIESITEIEPTKGIKDVKKLKELMKAETWGHHASCSCRMGQSIKDGVVDTDFNVHGVKGLRVVDASVFPKIPGLFIVLPIYMIAEKAATVISKDFNKKI